MRPHYLLVSAALIACLASHGTAQTQRVLEDRTGGRLIPTPVWMPARDIREFFGTAIATAEFQGERPLIEVLLRIKASLPKKGKDFEFVIDQETFRQESPDDPDPLQALVKFPEYPKRLTAGTALRLALSKVPTNNAVYWLRSGQLVITTFDKVQTTFFLDEPVRIEHIKNKPLVQALDELAEWTGASIVVDRRVLRQAQVPVTARVADHKLGTILRLLTDMAGLRHVLVDNVIYVTSPENAKAIRSGALVAKKHGTTLEETIANRPLAEFLDHWGKNMGLVVDARIKQKTRAKVTAKFLNHVNVETALWLLTDMAGLRYAIVDDAFYITSPDNARRLQEEQDRKKPAAEPPPAKAPAKVEYIDPVREFVAEYKDLRLLNAMPVRGYIGGERAWAKFWKSLGEEKPPPVDFAKELVAVGVAGCPKTSVDATYVLSDKGDLRCQFERRTVSGEGFVVLMSVLPRERIKTIHGEAIRKD